MRVVSLLLLLAATGCHDVKQKPTKVSIPTPDGEAVAHKTTVDPTPQEITLVAGAKLDKLRALSARGPAFVAAYLPDVASPDLKDYDRAFRAWQVAPQKAHTKEQVVEILGGVLGNQCVDDLKMEWVTVNDEYGTDLAVRSKGVEVMGFPFSTVLKRIEDEEYDFLYGVYHTLKHAVEKGDYKARDAGARK